MRVKQKLGAAAAAALAVSATGVVFAASASATSTTYLCASGSLNCALDQGVNNQVAISIPSGSVWVYSTSTTYWIRLKDTNLCMQLEHNNNNIVVEKTCSGSILGQEWIPVPKGDPGNVAWKSESNPGLCLNDDVYTGELNAATCNYGPNEIWLTG